METHVLTRTMLRLTGAFVMNTIPAFEDNILPVLRLVRANAITTSRVTYTLVVSASRMIQWFFVCFQTG
jgi:hypothetical protein